jgi:hypothetical protein
LGRIYAGDPTNYPTRSNGEITVVDQQDPTASNGQIAVDRKTMVSTR